MSSSIPKNNQRPIVSVVIPAYNASLHIRDTLQSVQNQTYENLEIIVVDDGSTDDTASIVKELAERDGRIRLLRQENRGVAAARNYGIEEACGEFIAPIDADDIWLPDKIEEQVRCFEQNGPEVGLVYTWWMGLSEDGYVTGYADRWDAEGYVYKSLLYRNFIGNASVPLIRRTAIDVVGGYDTSLREQGGQGCEDWDLALRIAEYFEFRLVRSYLTGYRKSVGSMSTSIESMAKSYILVIGKVKRKHAELPLEIFTWSSGSFFAYLAAQCYNNGFALCSIKWAIRAVGADRALLLNVGLMLQTIKSVLRLIVRPVTRLIWPDQRSWLKFRNRVLGSRKQPWNRTNHAEGKPSWAWKSSRPYDRISMRRWKELGAETRKVVQFVE